MAWSPSSFVLGGETFVEADFAPFAFAATWPRFLGALAQHIADVAALAGIQQAGTVAGTGSAYTFTPAAPLLSGQGLWFRPNVNNTGACTADGKPVKRSDGSDPAANELVAGTEYLLRYDGTNLRVLSLNVALAALSRLTPAADRLPYFTGAAGAALATFTAFARDLLAAVDDAAARGVLGAQASSAMLSAIAALAWSSGAQVPVLTAADTFALRTIGVAAGTNLLDRDGGDGRFLGIAMVQVATNIATADGIAYTYDTPFDVPDGGILIWKPPSGNAASSSITASRNPGGTARTIRNSDGAQIATAGLMRGGRTAILQRDGAVLVHTGLDLVQWFFNRVRFVGASASLDFQDSDAQTVGPVRLLQSSGQLKGYVEGDGSNLGTLALDVRASGLRGPQGAGFVNENGERYFDPLNPPKWWQDIQAHLELLTDGYWEDQLAIVQVSAGEAYPISGTDRSLDTLTSGQVYRTNGMALGQDVNLRVRTGATATIIAPQVWAGTEDGLSRSNADFGNVTSDAVASTFVFTAGDPAASWRRGDVIRPASLAATANNGVDFTILAFGGTSNRTVTVTPPPATDAVADSAWTMTRQGTRQLALTPGYYVIRREQTLFLAEVRQLFTAAQTATLPAPALLMAGDGQSWMVRLMRFLLRGWAETRERMGLGRDLEFIEGTAFGASSELRGFDPTLPYMGDGSYVAGVSTDNGNFLVDHFNDEAGPNLIAMRDAINRHPHKALLRYLPLAHGLNVMQNLTEAGDLTPDDVIAARIFAADYLMAETGLDLEWLVSAGPPAGDESAAVFPNNRYWPMRDAYVRLTRQDARFKRAMEFYDLLRNRRGERHHPFQEMRRYGRRLALFHAEQINKLTNRAVSGAAAGTPGTMPTNWSLTVGAGLTREVVGSGTSAAGRPYADVRISGTASGSAGQLLAFEAANAIAAVSGQAWTASGWLSIVAGSTSGLNALRMSVVGTNGSSNIEDTDTAALATISGTATRFTASRTLNNAGTTHIRGGIEYTYSAGAVLDFTLRIEGPMLERGSVASPVWVGPQWLGPDITAFDQLTTTSFRYTVDYGIGQGIKTPPLPVGLALLPAGSSQFDTPLSVVRWQRQNGPGTTIYYTAYTAAASGGARPAFPWGPAEDLQAPSNLIRAYSAVIDDWLPLRTLDRVALGL